MVCFGEAFRLLGGRRLGGLWFGRFRGRLGRFGFGVSVTLGVSVCFGSSVSAGFAVSDLPLSAGAVLLSCSFSVVYSVVLSVPAGRLLSAVGSAVLSVTVAVMPLSVLAGSLPVFSVLSAPHPARLSVISPARRAASIFRFVIMITSTYRIPKKFGKSSEICTFQKKVTSFVQGFRPHRVIRPRIPPKPHGKRRERRR